MTYRPSTLTLLHLEPTSEQSICSESTASQPCTSTIGTPK